MAATTYKVVTRHTKTMLRDFVKFRNRITAPTMTFRFVMLSACFYTFGLIVLKDRTSTPAIVSYVLGTLLLGFGLFRSTIGANKLAKVDKHYQEQNDITFSFGTGGFTVESGSEEDAHFRYSDVDLSYKDAVYYYIGTKNSDLFLLPKADFIEGGEEGFEEFMNRKTGVTMQMTKLPWKVKLAILMQARDMAYDEHQQKKKNKK